MRRARMTEDALDLVAARFRALAEPMRLRILNALCAGERSVNTLVQELGATQANVSKHLGLLLSAGLVKRRKAGLNVFYQVSDRSVFRLCDVVCSSLEKHVDRHAQALRGNRAVRRVRG